MGLAAYMVGPGKANEHTNPHLVAGSAPIMAWWSDATLSHEDALQIGAEIEQPHKTFGTNVAGGHIWHTSLSLHRDDGIMSDQKWEEMSREFMAEMGFIDVEGKADVRWAAFRHGLSGTTGNDHVHLVVSLVREDGTKADVWNDRHKAQRIAREMEKRHGLMTRIEGRGVAALSMADIQTAERRGLAEPEKVTAARKVRAFAAASKTEAEFIRRCRRDGLLVRPRFAAGSTTEVVGYAVAMKPPPGETAYYSAASKMDKTLGLFELRKGWEETPESRAEAVEEWHRAKYGRRVSTEGREVETVDENAMLEAAQDLEAMRVRLRDVPLDDHEQWRQVASFASKAFSAWSQVAEATPGPFAHIADELARSAQMSRHAYDSKPVPGPMGLRTATMLAIAAGRGGPSAKRAVFTQLSYLMRAIHDHNTERRDQIRTQAMMKVVTSDLTAVTERLDAAAAKEKELVGASAGRARGASRGVGRESVVPTKLRSVKESDADLSR